MELDVIDGRILDESHLVELLHKEAPICMSLETIVAQSEVKSDDTALTEQP